MTHVFLGAPSNTHAVVVGGGIMGADIAVVLLRAECQTIVVEPNETRHAAARTQIHDNLKAIGREASIKFLSFAKSIDDIDWASTQLMIECVPEKLDIKQALFKRLDALAPETTVLASNSSSFAIRQIAEGCTTLQRMIGLHFFMPAHLVPLVEVIHGPGMLPVLAEELTAFMRRCGCVPIQVRRDAPGFIGNRLQHALGREAFSLIQDGVATAEDIDNAVRFGFGFRYLAAGPVLQKEHAGLDTHAAAAATIYPSLSNVSQPPAVLADKPRQNKLGMKTGEGFYAWTDESIAVEKARYNQALRAALQILANDLPPIEP
ncbi:MAG: 3-hydroxyacyl-CoA dehydrogenase [Alcaligenaceae bacterium]|nr:3-hydroxyacyl-CoA dehydrogenase [Alcaligenaceae bacterium]